MQHYIAPRPLAYFNFVYMYAGGARSTVQLIRELQHLTPVRVIDAYGTCEEYRASLAGLGIEPAVLLPEWPGRMTIGGKQSPQRSVRLLSAVFDMLQVALRLRVVLREIRPRAVWVDNEKSLFMVWLAAAPDVPIVYFLRGDLARIRPYCVLAWRRVNAVVSVSENNLHHLRTTTFGRGNLRAIYDGIDVDQLIARSHTAADDLPPRSDGRLRIVFPAVIAGPLKGHEIAIRAVAEFIAGGGQADLLLCGAVPPEGSTEFFKRMQDLSRELGIAEYVHFLGWRNDVPAIMAQSDIVMLPSYTEGLPVSLMEAMALARPVVSTRVGGIPELVREGIDGLLVEAGDVAGVARALRTLTDPARRTAMGRAGQARMRSQFTLSGQAQRFWQCIGACSQQAPPSEMYPETERKIL